MTAKIIDGKAIAEAVRQEAADEVAVLRQQYGTVPTLAAVLVGDNPASQTYVSSKGLDKGSIHTCKEDDHCQRNSSFRSKNFFPRIPG